MKYLIAFLVTATAVADVEAGPFRRRAVVRPAAVVVPASPRPFLGTAVVPAPKFPAGSCPGGVCPAPVPAKK